MGGNAIEKNQLCSNRWTGICVTFQNFQVMLPYLFMIFFNVCNFSWHVIWHFLNFDNHTEGLVRKNKTLMSRQEKVRIAIT